MRLYHFTIIEEGKIIGQNYYTKVGDGNMIGKGDYTSVRDGNVPSYYTLKTFPYSELSFKKLYSSNSKINVSKMEFSKANFSRFLLCVCMEVP